MYFACYEFAEFLEIDFVNETAKRTQKSPPRVVCIEVKYSKRWDRRWESAIRGLDESKQIRVEKMIGVYGGSERLTFDSFQVLPIPDFLTALSRGDIF